MAFNPNAVFVSPSSLGDLDKCPQLYYYRSVYKSPKTGLKIQLTNPALALGSTIHDVIERFLSLEPSARTEEELSRLLDFVWENITGEKGGFADKAEEETYLSRAREMLRRFWANDHFHTCLGVKIPAFPKVDLGPDLILTGKLDWIEMGEDKYYHIIDFKTGKNKEKEDSLQLPIYAIMVSQLFKTDKIRGKYWYLDSEGEMEDITLPDVASALETVTRKAETAKMVRRTNSYRCQSGEESCWACRDMLAVARGEGRLVSVDMSRKHEIYILPAKKDQFEYAQDLPF